MAKPRFTSSRGWAKGMPMLTNHPARIALCPLLWWLALAGAGAAAAAGLASHDSNAPVNYAADRIELQDKQDRVLLTGNVEITHGDLRMHAARTLVAYTNAGDIHIQRIDATGGVVVTRGEESASGEVANYDFNRRIITLVGHVVLHRGSDVSNGARLVIDLESGHSAFVGANGGVSQGGASGGGRVTGSFSVARHKDAGK